MTESVGKKKTTNWSNLAGAILSVLVMCVAFGSSLGVGVRAFHYFADTACQQSK